MKPILVKDVKPFLDSTAIAYVRFSDNTNETVVPYNSKRSDTKPIVSQFLDRLKTSLYPDGVYYMFLKDTMNGKERVIPVIKGAMPKEIPARPEKEAPQPKEVVPVLLAEKPKVTVNEQANEGMVSYKDFMDLKVEVVALQFENQRLQEIIEEYESMDEEGEEQPNQFKDIIENMLIPLSDKYFEIKKQELELLSAKPQTNAVAVKKPLNVSLVKKHINANYVTPQQPVRPSQAGGASFVPDGNPEQASPEILPDEQQVINEIMSYDEAQVIEFYNAASEAGEGDAAYSLLMSLRPDLEYLFVPNSEQNEQSN